MPDDVAALRLAGLASLWRESPMSSRDIVKVGRPDSACRSDRGRVRPVGSDRFGRVCSNYIRSCGVTLSNYPGLRRKFCLIFPQVPIRFLDMMAEIVNLFLDEFFQVIPWFVMNFLFRDIGSAIGDMNDLIVQLSIQPVCLRRNALEWIV